VSSRLATLKGCPTFIRFNIVGVIGFALQLAVLLGLEASGVPIAMATLIAVEAAVLHNFIWHERWTWAGMVGGSCRVRLARFHVSNGLISLVGNALVTTALTQIGTPTIVASVAAVLMCALANFAAAHLWVFCAKTWPTFHGHVH
jgi:putative flippase GtrA